MGILSHELRCVVPCECSYCWENLFLKFTHKRLWDSRVFCYSKIPWLEVRRSIQGKDYENLKTLHRIRGKKNTSVY
jgi:hypothetical protein